MPHTQGPCERYVEAIPSCGCRIAGPLGLGALLGEVPAREIGGAAYSVAHCPLHASAPDLLAALRMADIVITKGNGLGTKDRSDAIDAIRDALRKARGEAP